MFTPKKHSPKIDLSEIRQQKEKLGKKITNLVIPLYGEFTLNDKSFLGVFDFNNNVKKGEDIA
jgi:hypothetical protein